MSVAEFGQGNRPDSALVAPQRMKRLVPPAVMQIVAPAVFAHFRRAAANAEMPAAAAHPTLVAERHMRLANRVGLVVVIL